MQTKPIGLCIGMLFIFRHGGNMMYDVAIIGCGVVGAATAYQLARYELDLLVLEADNDVANGTSKANSAILHAGYDPHPGTLMARLNVEGAAMAKELCQKLDVPYRNCGSLVVAFSDEEMTEVQKLYERGVQNGVERLEVIGQDRLRELEPNISEQAVGALYAPTAAIVNPWEMTLALAEMAVLNGADLRLDSAVTAISPVEGGYLIETTGGVFEARYIVNAAGVYSDIVHNMAAPPTFTIRPDRGVYYLLDKSEGIRAMHVVFQCPTPKGKGVLVSPTVHGNLIVGPDNEPPRDRDDTATTAAGLAYVLETSKKSIPSINFRENIRNFAGIRAAAVGVDDFIIAEAEGAPGFIDLAGVKSPGLTAAPAIGVMAADLLRDSGLEMKKKPGFIDVRRQLRFNQLTAEQKAQTVSENPAYGRVICRCETVTEGEILDALKGPIPPRSVDAVKRRCMTGMGRCQGGFCGPRIVDILSRELGVSPLDIPNDRAGSYILSGPTKGG